MPKRSSGLNGLPIHIRAGRYICYVKTGDGERKQRALHIRADGTPASERAAVAAYWQEQSRATAGRDVRKGKPEKTLRKGLEAVMAAQEVEGCGLDALSKTFFMGRNLTQFFGPDFDLTTLTEPRQLVDYAAEALKKRCVVTVKQEFGVLGQAMRKLGLARPDPPKLKGKSKPQEPLSEEEQRKFLLAATPKHKLTILLLLTLGPRRSEVGKIGEISWEKQTMWILGTKTENSKREIPIPDELFEEMQVVRARGEWKGFPNVTGRRIYAIVVSTCKRAGIPRRHPNDIRGTASRRLRAAGVDAELRGAIQGNSARMQEQTYTQTHTMTEAMREALAATKRIKQKGGLMQSGSNSISSITSATTTASNAPNTSGRDGGTDTESLEKGSVIPG